MNIGKKIGELRKKNNLTQEKLAEKFGVSRQTLANWENNVTLPNLEQTLLISREFKISVDYLIDNEIDVICKNSFENNVLKDLIGKMCKLTLSEECESEINLINRIVKVIEVNNDFIKIEYQKNKKKIIQLIDINLIERIKCLEEE